MENRVKGIGKDSVIVSWLVSNASDSHIIFIFYFIPRNLLAFTFLSSFFSPSILSVNSSTDQYPDQITPQCVLALSRQASALPQNDKPRYSVLFLA